MKDWLPTPPTIAREAIAVIAGAFLAALVFQLLPDAYKQWVRDNLPTKN